MINKCQVKILKMSEKMLMNKETRILKKVTYEDYIENDLIFTKLMGKEVKSRKKFIISHFDEVNVLDI